MKAKFAMTSNVERFLSGLVALENRAAPEASWLLVTGRPGYGKSETVKWWAIQQGAVYLRARADWTSHWLMTDLISELGHAPERSSEEMFRQVIPLIRGGKLSLVIDEVEHCLHDSRVLEKLRDLSDVALIPIIIVGMEDVRGRLLRHEQVSSRICQAVEFGPATLDDIRLLASELAEVVVADDLVAEIHAASNGLVRVALDALAEVERHGRRQHLLTVTLADMAGHKLVHDWRSRKTITARKPRAGLEAVK